MPGLRRTGRRGYTLIELLLVISLISLTAVVAVPKYNATLQNLRVRNGAYLIAADLRLAQATARQEMKYARLVLVPGAGPGEYLGYQVQVARRPQTPASCDPTAEYNTVKKVDTTLEFPKQVSLTDVDVPCIVFEPSGRPAWKDPLVVSATLPGKGVPASLLDGLEWRSKPGSPSPTCNQLRLDSSVVTWTVAGATAVTVTVDLGEKRPLDWAYPQVLIHDVAGIEKYTAPDSITVSAAATEAELTAPGVWSQSITGSVVPDSRCSPYKRYIPNLSTFPVIANGAPVQFLRFTIDPGTNLAIDEIQISAPGIRVTGVGGSVERKVEVLPVTGHVQVN